MSVATSVTQRTARSISNNLILPSSSTGGVPNAGMVSQTFNLQPTLAGLLKGGEPGKGTQRTMQPGRYYDFDGVNDYVDLGSALDLGGENTVAFWVKTASTSWCIAGNNGSDYLLYFITDTFYFRGGTTGGPATCAVTIPNEWTHIAVCRTGTTIKFWINGIEQTVSGTVGAGPNTTFRYIAFSGIAGYIDGNLSDVRAYNSALTLSEVRELATLGTGALPNKSTVLHLKCDDTHPTIAYDSSGNGNDGTKTNITTSTFHAEGSDAPHSFLNDKGYSDSANGPVPRDESDKTKDVLGATLDYSGKCPRNAQLIDSNCATPDGTNDYVDIGDISASVKSIEFWINPDSVTSHTDYVIDLNGTDYITIVNGTVTVNGFAAASTTVYVDGVAGSTVTANWHHVAIVSDTGFSASDLDIARLEGTGYFAGSICAVRLFSDELTSSEVLSEHNGEGTTLDNDAGYWPMAEGAGDTHYDVSGNDNHGTITGHAESTYFGTTQDVFHWNYVKGFSKYTHASNADMYVPYSASGSALSITPQTGYTKDDDHPAGAFHNGAESQINQAPVAAPTENYAVRDNLLEHSSELDNANWIKVRSSVNANQVEAADGTFTMDEIVEDSTASNTHAIYTAVTLVDGGQFTLSLHLRGNTRTNARLMLADSFGANGIRVDADLTAGTLSNGTTSGSGWTYISSSIEKIGDDYRVKLTGIAASNTSGYVFVSILDDTGNYVYSGDGASSIYAGLGKVEQWHEATPYIDSDRASEEPITDWEFPVEKFSNTAFSGAVAGTPGTLPTSWVLGLANGTLAVSGTELTFSATSDRQFMAQAQALLANSIYEFKVTSTVNSGTIPISSAIVYESFPSGASASYFIDGVGVSTAENLSGTQELKIVIRTGDTAGPSFKARLGIGCGGNTTGSITLSSPSFKRNYQNPNFYRQITKNGILYRADRWLNHDQILVGQRATSAEQYTTTTTV